VRSGAAGLYSNAWALERHSAFVDLLIGLSRGGCVNSGPFSGHEGPPGICLSLHTRTGAVDGNGEGFAGPTRARGNTFLQRI
jgi:hypothetical protein